MKSYKLLTPQFLKKLETLQVLSKKIIRGTIKGERSSVKRGRSVEFSDYRDYVPGDEIRIIDWNIYGRLDKLFVKLFVEEEELILYLLVDRSVSMDFGTPSKLEIALKICAALSYVALANYDRVSLGLMDTEMSGFQPPIRGKKQVFRVFEFLENVKPGGKTSLKSALGQFASRKMRPGLVVILSDFLDAGDFLSSLEFLMFKKFEIFLLHILDPFELDPDIGGDVKLIDVETGDFKEVTVTDQLLDMYKSNLEQFCGQIRSFCRNTGAGYLLAPTSVPFEDLVLKYLRLENLLR